MSRIAFNALLDNEWWKNDTPVVLERVYEKLLTIGMTDAGASSLLDTVIDAIRNEYGD